VNRSGVFRPGLLDGQVGIVTGGGSGLGRAIALELAALGMHVVVCGRRLEPLVETRTLAGGSTCSAETCDVRDEWDVERVVGAVLERHGRIDLLVNNAGGQFLAPAEAITPKGFRAVVRLNLEGAWLMTHTVATQAMIPRRGGKVVSITLSPHNGLPGMAHSSAARAGVENLMRGLSIEWARYGILLNAVAAGYVGTETFVTKYPEAFVEAAAGNVPLGRMGRPDEIAWLVAYLASPAGDHTTGTVLTVDGGRDNHLGAWPPDGEVDANGNPLAERRAVRPPLRG
jgi:citronellol/citronellal dehydrogenase